ncbi:MAG: hypothetical protein ACFFB3_03865 [Candidatus Hodarchaeota archaeon]
MAFLTLSITMRLMDLARHLADQAAQAFPEKIAIIAVYGSVALGNQTAFSDLDMYAIVDKSEDTDLPWEFVIRDRPVDFWKMDWNTAEKAAFGLEGPWSVAASTVVSSKILYARSDQDLARFESIRQKWKSFKEERWKFIIKKFNRMFAMMEWLKLSKENDDLPSARWASWRLINEAVNIFSVLKDQYLTKNWGSNLPQAFALSQVPEDFQKLILLLVTSQNFDELLLAAERFIRKTREAIRAQQKQLIRKDLNHQLTLGQNYPGVKAYVNKVRAACQQKDLLAASWAATDLQKWIVEEIAKIEGQVLANTSDFNFWAEVQDGYTRAGFPDFMDNISKADFDKLNQQALAFDQAFRQYCHNNDIPVRIFSEKSQLQEFLSKKIGFKMA